MRMAGSKRLSLEVPQEMYDEMVLAIARETLKTGERVSDSEFIRRALEDRVLMFSE